MAKFYGPIGFAETVEDPPDSGIAVSRIVERVYSGDIMRRNVTNETQAVVNPSLNINNEISIVIDNYILNNTHNMRYIGYLGTRWELRTISIDYPRMTITLGGLYNGPSPDDGTDDDPGGEETIPQLTPEGSAIRKASMVSAARKHQT